MFSNPFSFDGRIRRTEYGVSFIIYAFVAVIINARLRQHTENFNRYQRLQRNGVRDPPGSACCNKA